MIMGEKLHKIIMDHAPEYWDTGLDKTVLLSSSSTEYQEISAEILEARQLGANRPIKTIKRYQNVHDLGQFLVREQHLLHLKPNKLYYRVSFSNLYKLYLFIIL